jgi:hypothetical protein
MKTGLMMPVKTVAVIGAACAFAGWLLASVLTPPVARLQSLPERRAVRAAATPEAPAAFSERLHWKLQQAPAPPTPRRNPFRFGARTSATAVAVSTSTGTVAAAEGPLATAPPAPPPLTLSGIGIATSEAGDVLTAVVSDGQSVHLVKVGDSVAGYRVIDVTDGSLTLEAPSGARRVLRLR